MLEQIEFDFDIGTITIDCEGFEVNIHSVITNPMKISWSTKKYSCCITYGEFNGFWYYGYEFSIHNEGSYIPCKIDHEPLATAEDAILSAKIALKNRLRRVVFRDDAAKDSAQGLLDQMEK